MIIYDLLHDFSLAIDFDIPTIWLNVTICDLSTISWLTIEEDKKKVEFHYTTSPKNCQLLGAGSAAINVLKLAIDFEGYCWWGNHIHLRLVHLS